MLELNSLLETIEGDTIVELWNNGKKIKEGKAKILSLEWIRYNYKSMRIKNDNRIIIIEVE